MKPRNASSAILGGAARKPPKFHNGMFVRYTGHQPSQMSRHYMATTPIVPGATYTVARSVQDGADLWLFVQEWPEVRCTADGFVPIPHQAEDHWQMADL